MAIQILPKQPSIGELLGTGLGSGISSGLQHLAQMKMNELQERTKQQKTYNALLGANYSPDIAKAISAMPSEKMQIEALKNVGSNALANQTRAQYGLPTQETAQQPQNDFMSRFLALDGQKQEQVLESVKQMSPEQRQQLSLQLFPIAQQEQPVQQAPIQPSQQQTGLFSRAQTPQEIANLAKYEQREKKLSQQDKALAFKETKIARKDILDSAKADKENMMRIERMDLLNKEGKLNNPFFYSFLKSVGLDIPALLTPESQEFQKLTIDFLKNAKKMFGARITNFEAETFLKSIPSLTQTSEGRSRVIRNLKLLYQGSDMRKKAMQEIIKQNNGIPPFDLSEQIEEKIAPQIDVLANQFREGLLEKKKDNSEEGIQNSIEERNIPTSNNESSGEMIGRNIARLVSRAVESAIGLPGDIEGALRSIDDAYSFTASGKIENKIRDKVAPVGGFIDKIKSLFVGKDKTILPTSDDIKEKIQSSIGKVIPDSYLEPKNGWESFADNLVSDFVPLLIPLKGKIPFARALKTAGIGNLASFLARQVGIGERGQTIAKLGTTLLTSIGNPYTFKNYVQTLNPSEATKFAKEVGQSGKILKFINKLDIPGIKGIKLNPLISTIGLGLYTGKIGPLAAMTGAIYGTGALERFLSILSRNPDARKFYLNTLKSAARQNAGMTIKNIKKLNDVLNKEIK